MSRPTFAWPYPPPPLSLGDPQAGVLLANLGTPDAPTVPAVRRYLRQFLNDPRVIDLPRFRWWLLLEGIILRTRPARSAAAYARVWTDDGSPLLLGTQKLATAMQHELGLPVAVGMRYGSPSIATGLRELAAAGVTRMLVLPLYPQYAAASTASVFDAVFAELATWRVVPQLRTINSYARDPAWLAALATTIHEARAAHGVPDKLLVTWHGIPQRYVALGDPYEDECVTGTNDLIEAAGLDPASVTLAYQSRFGREEWLQPYAAETFARLPEEGVKHLHVISPGFSIDCLETLDEIAVEGAELFEHAGGAKLHYIPALNDRPDHVAAMTGIARRAMHGWLDDEE
ncbi:MAG: ferrochelatase [Planctomycetota bacterium]